MAIDKKSPKAGINVMPSINNPPAFVLKVLWVGIFTFEFTF